MMKSNVEERFSEFFEKWVCELEECFQQLLRVSRGCAKNVCERELQNLISRVTQMRASRLPGSSLSEVTQDQLRKIDQLRLKVRLEEEKVERQQVAITDRKMMELARLACRVKNGDRASRVDGLVEVASKGIMAGPAKVMKASDCARLRTLKGVWDILTHCNLCKDLFG